MYHEARFWVIDYLWHLRGAALGETGKKVTPSKRKGLSIGWPPNDCHTLVHPGLLGIAQVMPGSTLWPCGVSAVRYSPKMAPLLLGFQSSRGMRFSPLSITQPHVFSYNKNEQTKTSGYCGHLARKHRKHVLYTLTPGRKVWAEFTPRGSASGDLSSVLMPGLLRRLRVRTVLSEASKKTAV